MAAAGRFGSSSDIDIEAILADKDCKSTKNSSTKVALMCLNQYLFSIDRSLDFSTYSKVELDKLLASFYVGNSAFTPYITGCVVNFNVSMNKQ